MYDIYKIKYNETLSDIAKKFNTNVKILKDINNLYYIDNLREGTEIIVPKDKEDYFETYKIETGDSLYKIGRRYNINPELLASLNGLDMEDYIYPNQEILIPKSGYSYYITKEGDTLDIASEIFNTSKERLLKYNTSIYLLPGQIIVNKKN